MSTVKYLDDDYTLSPVAAAVFSVQSSVTWEPSNTDFEGVTLTMLSQTELCQLHINNTVTVLSTNAMRYNFLVKFKYK